MISIIIFLLKVWYGLLGLIGRFLYYLFFILREKKFMKKLEILENLKGNKLEETYNKIEKWYNFNLNKDDYNLIILKSRTNFMIHMNFYNTIVGNTQQEDSYDIFTFFFTMTFLILLLKLKLLQ